MAVRGLCSSRKRLTASSYSRCALVRCSSETPPHEAKRAAAPSTSHLRADPTDAIVSDALKLALRQQGWPEYANAFGHMRAKITGQRR